MIDLFPNKVATLFSYNEMCIGLGYMLGPPLGSFLYELGGFILPFEVVGSVCICAAIGVYFSIPTTTNTASVITSLQNGDKKRITLTDVVVNPTIFLPLVDNFMCYCGYGMLEAMLEPHMMKTVNATQKHVGIAFLISGIVYMCLTIIVGYVSMVYS